jgi:hypothetical protein
MGFHALPWYQLNSYSYFQYNSGGLDEIRKGWAEDKVFYGAERYQHGRTGSENRTVF